MGRDAETSHGGSFIIRRIVGASLVLLLAVLVAFTLGLAEDAETLGKRGKQLFTQQGCYGCHMIEKYGTPIATDLSHIGAKYDRAYLLRWLRDPSAEKPTAHMPKIALSDAEAQALAAYLASLR
jgi:mono/diheme cytochrome c family protein